MFLDSSVQEGDKNIQLDGYNLLRADRPMLVMLVSYIGLQAKIVLNLKIFGQILRF